MEVTMGSEASMDEDEQGQHGPNGAHGGEGSMDFDEMELADRARELGRKARDWVALNPFAALGIAVVTGFIAGRAMRTWALRL